MKNKLQDEQLHEEIRTADDEEPQGLRNQGARRSGGTIAEDMGKEKGDGDNEEGGTGEYGLQRQTGGLLDKEVQEVNPGVEGSRLAERNEGMPEKLGNVRQVPLLPGRPQWSGTEQGIC